MSKARPIPDDFIALAPTMTMGAAREYWAAGGKTLARFSKETGVSFAFGNAVKTVPADWHKVTEMTRGEAFAYFDICRATYERFCKETGIKAKKPAAPANKLPDKIPLPRDFIANARRMTVWGLRELYGYGTDRVMRMLEQEGIPPLRRKMPSTFGSGSSTALAGVAPSGVCDMAARHLQRFYKPVYRMPKNIALVKGKTWYCGRLELTDAELLDRAQEKGWQADGWKMVADRKGFRVGGEMVG